MGDPILNLSTWIDRRRKEVGPYADHIVHSVKAYEARITAIEEENQRLREGLLRIATPIAFYVATSKVDPDSFARMTYADKVLGGTDLELAEKETEAETKDRYPLRAALEGE